MAVPTVFLLGCRLIAEGIFFQAESVALFEEPVEVAEDLAHDQKEGRGSDRTKESLSQGIRGPGFAAEQLEDLLLAAALSFQEVLDHRGRRVKGGAMSWEHTVHLLLL